ncbi:hypothetical protein IQ273_00440 [Nodosilinea sp. LEGE 07298]|uniref:hypothetical protein n=1 Tax=Nodosilinea sp. LEGE 07298 TaxID=2777970 RepID=UPI00187EA9A2|nr:hypothetical protein [Nodosilinea sp. LEGE 07298]MBE9107893.1 hypothetical protein [Nodosilinea sp. LEGE 07298]
MTVISTALRPTQRLRRIAALIGLCSLAAAVPSLTPNPQRISFPPIAASLDGIATLPTLRLPVSLPTGTHVTPPIGSGYSQLTVKNGNPVDAVFKLVDVNSGQTLRFMYVQANDNLTVDDLGTCTCDLRFATGIDWDVEQQQFRRSMALSAFSDPAEFAITIEDDIEYWSTLEVTLHPVPEGKAQTEALSEDEF